MQLYDSHERRRQLAFHVIALIAITPFGFWMVLQGPRLHGFITLAACACILLSTLMIWRQQWTRVGRIIACVGPALAIWFFMHSMPQFGMLWSYPLAVFFYLYLDMRLAVLANTLFVLGLAWAGWGVLPVDVYSRLLATHLVIGTMTSLFARTIRSQQRALRRAAETDSLTGLANRRAVQDALESWQRQRSRYGVPATLLLIDLDHFKAVNDQAGHQAGDALLQRVAEVLRRRARDTDMAGRWGGEEFVMVLPHTHAQEAQVVADAVRIGVAALNDDRQPLVTASIGIADLAANESPESWIARADAALYQAKAAGRNRVMIAPPDGEIAD